MLPRGRMAPFRGEHCQGASHSTVSSRALPIGYGPLKADGLMGGLNSIAGGTGGTPTLLTTIVSLDPIYFNFDMSESDFLAYQRATARGPRCDTCDRPR